jgi:hypothetical protein
MSPEAKTPSAVSPNVTRKTSRGRRIVAAILIVVSCVLAPLSIAAVWIRGEVLSTDRYLATVGPLADDPAIQRAVADATVNTLFATVDVKAEAAAVLPSKAGFLAGPLADQLEQYARTAAYSFFASSTFAHLWRTANEQAHEQVRKLLTGSGTVVTTRGDEVVLDLGPVAVQVRAALQKQGIHIFDAVPVANLVPKLELFNAKQLNSAQTAVDLLNKLTWILVILTFITLVVGVWLSPNRRRTLLRWGFGVAAAIGVVGAGLSVGRSIYLNGVSSPQLPRGAAAAAFDVITDSFRNGLRLVLVLALIVALAAWLTGSNPYAGELRAAVRDAIGGVGRRVGEGGVRFGAVGRWVVPRRAPLRVAGALVTLVVLMFWNAPRVSTVLGLAVALLVYLGVVELIARAAGATPDGTAPPRVGS